MGNLKVAGISISLTAFSFLALAIWIKALGLMIDPWFIQNYKIIFYVSTAAVIIFVALGAISIKSWAKKVSA